MVESYVGMNSRINVRSVVLSPKIIYFNSMKNLIHAMRDMNITNSLKASISDENFTKL